MKHVYIIEAGNGHKKIGVAGNIENRINQLKTGISTGIKSVMITEKMSDSHSIEKHLHKINNNIRLSGEWFDGELNLDEVKFAEHFAYQDRGDVTNCNILMLANMIDAVSGSPQVLSYLLKNKNKYNEVCGTQRFIAKAIGASLPTVNKQIKLLIKYNYLSQVSGGCYLFNHVSLR